MPCNAEAPADVRPLPREAACDAGADKRDSSSTAERLRLLLTETTETGAEIEVEALAEGAIEVE